jgi:hypothetical protein
MKIRITHGRYQGKGNYLFNLKDAFIKDGSLLKLGEISTGRVVEKYLFEVVSSDRNRDYIPYYTGEFFSPKRYGLSHSTSARVVEILKDEEGFYFNN